MNLELDAWIGGQRVAVPACVPRIELKSPVDGSVTYRMPDAGGLVIAPSIEDVMDLAEPVLKHRMALSFAARTEGQDIGGIIKRLAARVT